MVNALKKGKSKDLLTVIIFCIGIVIIVLAPWIMVTAIKPTSFKDTGQIGDTIGGITAPIASLLGSFLIYKALQAQIAANEIIVNQFDEQKNDETRDRILGNITDRIKFLRDDIHEFSFGGFKGFQAIDQSLQIWIASGPQNINNHYALYIRQIGSILAIMNDTIIYLERSDLKESEKENLKIIIKSTYYKILPYLYRERKNLPSDVASIYTEINDRLEILNPIEEADDLWSNFES
ncbi:hypothetical protein D3H65_15965 [Paraflavitalea soli]|uniref:Uncharacterized protein n=1 Tax=Paraflavitalea soli TaxID=2315862 RepID=A0A3B7MPZ7_9BACT|nr:hypothetical protein [Paraflavitalea soli]AXY75389.1 hypothetical protein D3H65_15965 [Paraflavitalea soli]